MIPTLATSHLPGPGAARPAAPTLTLASALPAVLALALLLGAGPSAAWQPADGPALGWSDEQVELIDSTSGLPARQAVAKLPWPPIKVPYCIAPVSAFELQPWSSADSYVSEIDARYFSGGSIPSLLSPVDTTTLPEGARLSQICVLLRDSSTTSDIALALIRARADAGGACTFQLLLSTTISSGMPGNTQGCATLDHTVARRGDLDGDGDTDWATYYLVIGPSNTTAPPLDGTNAIRQIWLRWDTPDGFSGPCLQ
jgi:hypothetical protein